MARKGENIYKRKDGRWEGRWIISHECGKAKYGYIYAKTYSEVRTELSFRRQNELTNKISSGKKLKSYYSNWIELIQLNRKESTCVKYRSIIEKHILPSFGELSMQQISTSDVGAFLLKKQQAGLSPSTVNGIKTVLKMFMNYIDSQNAVCNFSELRIKKGACNLRVLSNDEQNKLCQFLKKDMDCCKLGVYLCLFTGLRIGELCALRWKNVLTDRKVIYVESTMQRIKSESGGTKIVITSPKSISSRRVIPITDALAAVLEKYKASENSYVLSGSEDSFIEPRTLQYRFKKYIEAAGISAANFHSTRHTFATRCIENGVDVKSLSEILGHSNIGITLNRYVHSSLEFKRENMEKLLSIM